MQHWAPKFFRLWGLSFLWLALVPAGVAWVLALIPGGQMLAILPAFVLCLPGYFLVGPPHFSSEFVIATDRFGFTVTLGAWIVISALFAGAVLVSRPRGGQ